MTVVLVLMKLIPAIPGHFTAYEWIAVAIRSSRAVATPRRADRIAYERGVGVVSRILQCAFLLEPFDDRFRGNC